MTEARGALPSLAAEGSGAGNAHIFGGVKIIVERDHHIKYKSSTAKIAGAEQAITAGISTGDRNVFAVGCDLLIAGLRELIQAEGFYNDQ